MILQRIAANLKKRDWFTFALEALIVAFGVYFGIYLSDLQAERINQVETNQALTVLQSELESDLVRLAEVIEIQETRRQEIAEMVSMLSGPDFDREQFGILLFRMTEGLSMFFPNGSAFRIMQAGGYLASLQNPSLQLILSRLHEREHQRLAANLDLFVGAFNSLVDVRDKNWLRGESRFLDDDPNRRFMLQNALMALGGNLDFILGYETTQIRPAMVDTIGKIAGYLDGSDQ